MVSECTDVRKVDKVHQAYDANNAVRPPQINYKSMQLNTRHPGHYTRYFSIEILANKLGKLVGGTCCDPWLSDTPSPDHMGTGA